MLAEPDFSKFLTENHPITDAQHNYKDDRYLLFTALYIHLTLRARVVAFLLSYSLLSSPLMLVIVAL